MRIFPPLLLCFVSALAFGQACVPTSSQTCTPNLSLALPNVNSPNWNAPPNQNFSQIDSLLSGNTWIPGLKASWLHKEVWVDGVINTTIQQALTSLGGSGIVRLPAGYSQTISSCISIISNQVAIVGPQYGSAGIIINADSDGFCPARAVENFRLENVSCTTAIGIVLTSNHACIHLQDSPRPIIRNTINSTEATAGGCILIEGTQTNPVFGPWDGIIENNTCQRTTRNQGTPDSKLGHFGIWLKGNGGFTNADVSMNLLNKNWVENHSVGLRLTTANSNTVTRQHLLLNSINLLIESTSMDNFIVARLNQFRNSGSPVSGTNEHYNIDASSTDNILWLKLETPTTKGTDVSTRDNLMLGATDAWNIGSAVNFQSSSQFTETAAPSGVPGRDVCYGDSTAHALKCNYNNTRFLNQTQTVASGTATMTTAAIASGACGSTVTVAATEVQTTDAIAWAFNARPGTNPGLLTVTAWPTAGSVNFAYCNASANSVTPSPATINWRVAR